MKISLTFLSFISQSKQLLDLFFESRQDFFSVKIFMYLHHEVFGFVCTICTWGFEYHHRKLCCQFWSRLSITRQISFEEGKSLRNRF